MIKLLYYVKRIPIRFLTELYGLYYSLFGNVSNLDNENGYNRIYFYHIKKTGGTSINKMFYAMHYENYEDAYSLMCKAPRLRLNNDKFSYCSWNKVQLFLGRYNYGHSHYPFHNISIPKNTYTFSIVRDPIKRVISQYKMYLDFYEIGRSTIDKFDASKHPGETLIDFVNNVDDKVIMNQLYFFSKKFNIDEAIKNIESLNTYFFIDDFDQGVEKINNDLGLDLKPMHNRKSENSYVIKDFEIEYLRKKVKKEIEFLNILKERMRQNS